MSKKKITVLVNQLQTWFQEYCKHNDVKTPNTRASTQVADHFGKIAQLYPK